jgi:hypothetical protein
MTQKKDKNITGRPSKFGDVWTEENQKKTLELYSEGAGDIEIIALLGIARDTFYNWLKDKEKLVFSDTIKRGKVLSQVWWERNGRMNLHSKDFNNNLWARNMTCRFKEDWSEKQEEKNTIINIVDKGKDYEVINESK